MQTFKAFLSESTKTLPHWPKTKEEAIDVYMTIAANNNSLPSVDDFLVEHNDDGSVSFYSTNVSFTETDFIDGFLPFRIHIAENCDIKITCTKLRTFDGLPEKCSRITLYGFPIEETSFENFKPTKCNYIGINLDKQNAHLKRAVSLRGLNRESAIAIGVENTNAFVGVSPVEFSDLDHLETRTVSVYFDKITEHDLHNLPKPSGTLNLRCNTCCDIDASELDAIFPNTDYVHLFFLKRQPNFSNVLHFALSKVVVILETIAFTDASSPPARLAKIINKYTNSGTNKILEFQNELIDEGFEDIAEM